MRVAAVGRRGSGTSSFRGLGFRGRGVTGRRGFGAEGFRGGRILGCRGVGNAGPKCPEMSLGGVSM
jgi:hypothetical protein